MKYRSIARELLTAGKDKNALEADRLLRIIDDTLQYIEERKHAAEMQLSIDDLKNENNDDTYLLGKKHALEDVFIYLHRAIRDRKSSYSGPDEPPISG